MNDKTIKCNIMFPMTKSIKALSGEKLNSLCKVGFTTCIRKHTPKIKLPMHDITPLNNVLNGYVVPF